jgi:hypothetical protein
MAETTPFAESTSMYAEITSNFRLSTFSFSKNSLLFRFELAKATEKSLANPSKTVYLSPA